MPRGRHKKGKKEKLFKKRSQMDRNRRANIRL